MCAAAIKKQCHSERSEESLIFLNGGDARRNAAAI
jgi:hypothetical protein